MPDERAMVATVLGVCPRCGHRISAINELIEYERADGSRSQYAHCVDCDDVVRPQTET